VVLGQSFTGIFTCLAARSETGHCSVNARPLLAYATDAVPGTLINMSETMKQAFGLVRRPWGVFYLKHKITGQQTSLKTSDKHEAQRILQAHNESECQPHFNLSLARVYRATGIGAQLKGGASGVCETRGSHRAVAG
jgi:hypothetical protein